MEPSRKESDPSARPPGLLAVARERMRTRHLALRTEQAYLQWMRRYIAFHDRRHPRRLGAPEVEQFLTHLAVRRKVSAATQNQALQALLFLYRQVLEIELPWLNNVTRAGSAKRLPVVLTREEVRALLAQLQGAPVADRQPPLRWRPASHGGLAPSGQGPGGGARRAHRA